MSWMIREDKLDPDQRDFVNNQINKQGNIWIQGFAGSGKSILLVHSLREKLKKNPNLNACLVVYTRSLVDMFKTGMKEIGIPDRIPVMTYFEFKKGTNHYEYIFCDEVQDLPPSILQIMKSRCNHLIVAGDSNQSIFEKDPLSGELVVDSSQVGLLINARPIVLNYIHRLTRSIIQAVASLLPRMDIFGAKRDETKKDSYIRLCKGYEKEDEVKFIWNKAKEAVSVNDTSVILLPTYNTINEFVNLLAKITKTTVWIVKQNRYNKPDWEDLNNHFRNNNLKIEFVGSGYGSFQHADSNHNVILMTYHSAKGLDFDHVFLPFLSTDLYISPSKEETLFMVAMTRSRTNLFITYSGVLNYLVEKFRNNTSITEIDINSEINKKNNKSSEPSIDW